MSFDGRGISADQKVRHGAILFFILLFFGLFMCVFTSTLAWL
jgi:hypothetical protein